MWFCSQKWSSNRAAKMSGHVAWWRSVVDKTTRLQYDTECIGYTQLWCLHLPPKKHQYPRCRMKILWKHSIQNRSTYCFALETLSDQFCPHHYVARWNCAINSSQSPNDFLTKNLKFSAPKSRLFLFWIPLIFTIDLFTYWRVKFSSCARRRVFVVISVNRCFTMYKWWRLNWILPCSPCKRRMFLKRFKYYEGFTRFCGNALLIYVKCFPKRIKINMKNYIY